MPIITHDFSNEETQRNAHHAKSLCARLATMTSRDADYRAVITQLVPDLPASSVIHPPFQCDFGFNIHLAEDVFVNVCCVFLDTAPIRIGAHTLVGPNCQFYAPHHPLDPIERRKPIEQAFPITIGQDCWIGGNVTICPGVTIGARCIVAAGSVVTHSFPDDCLIAGNPAVIKRKLNEESK